MPDTTEEFSSFVAARQQALGRLAYLLTGEFHAAEDLVQIALARTYLRWDRIQDKATVEAYVRKTMVNEYTGWWRRAWRRREYITDVVPDRIAPIEDAPARDEVWAAVRRLPPRQRATIVLRYYEDLTETETATSLGCSVGTVKSQSSRAYATLRALLSDDSLLASEKGARP